MKKKKKKSVLNHIDVGVGCSHNRNFFFWVLLNIFNNSPFIFSIFNQQCFWKQLVNDTLLYLTVPIFQKYLYKLASFWQSDRTLLLQMSTDCDLGHTELPEGHSVEPKVPFAPALCLISKQDCDCHSLVCQLFYLENKQMQQDQMENTSNATNQTLLNHLQKCCLTCISRR